MINLTFGNIYETRLWLDAFTQEIAEKIRGFELSPI